MRVLITGGREFDDKELMTKVLDDFHNKHTITCVIHGAAKGADRLAGQWSLTNNVETEVYKADWKLHGKAAGPIRNTEMLQHSNPDLVIVFPGGKGTQDMKRKAISAGYDVITVHANPTQNG